jgi:hypothetical protein
LPLPSKIFTGYSAASIDVSDAIRATGRAGGSLTDRHELIG